jgi:hypothetical protein
MMEALIMKETDLCPEINFDAGAESLKISGKSLPEDSRTFYKPIIDWLTEFSNSKSDNLIMEFHLTYFNSSSAKQLLKILYVLEDRKEAGREVSVVWIYNQNDVMILERGQELAELVEVRFNFKEYSN